MKSGDPLTITDAIEIGCLLRLARVANSVSLAKTRTVRKLIEPGLTARLTAAALASGSETVCANKLPLGGPESRTVIATPSHHRRVRRIATNVVLSYRRVLLV